MVELGQEIPQHIELQTWHHPIISNALSILQAFADEPGDPILAWLIVQSAEELKTKSSRSNIELDFTEASLQKTQNSAYAWLCNEVASEAYHSDPARSTNQIEKALTCAVLLYCSLHSRLSLERMLKEKAETYVSSLVEHGWPQNALMPFVVAGLSEPRQVVSSAYSYLLSNLDRWRNGSQLIELSYVLVRCHTDLPESKLREAATTLIASIEHEPLSLETLSWILLAFDTLPNAYGQGCDQVTKNIFSLMVGSRLLNHELVPTLRLLLQGIVLSPSELAIRIKRLQDADYLPAQNIDVTPEKWT